MTSIAILYNIRSSENVGSIFRSSDAFGVSKIILTGYTPTPRDRFHRENSKIQKTALGAELYVPWEKRESIMGVISDLRREGCAIIASEISRDAMTLKSFRPPHSFAVIFGNEVLGLDQEVLNLCDERIQIPMRGKKESLNVAVAAGIVLYELSKYY